MQISPKNHQEDVPSPPNLSYANCWGTIENFSDPAHSTNGTHSDVRLGVQDSYVASGVVCQDLSALQQPEAQGGYSDWPPVANIVGGVWFDQPACHVAQPPHQDANEWTLLSPSDCWSNQQYSLHHSGSCGELVNGGLLKAMEMLPPFKLC